MEREDVSLYDVAKGGGDDRRPDPPHHSQLHNEGFNHVQFSSIGDLFVSTCSAPYTAGLRRVLKTGGAERGAKGNRTMALQTNG